MGNKIARTTQVSATEYYLHDLPSSYNLVLKEVLGRGRFFKSILCKHDEGLVLVKVYFKRGDSIDLREYERRLVKIKDVFLSLEHPHVWPFQFWQETDKAAFLVRQYFFSNLHDRLSTRPFLSLVEKKWLAFQLLLAVKQCHEKGICHGDIKCENVLVTSWNWLYLADFASFKPTYIPYDDPSDFSFFYDTRERRLCYLAPERFYEHGGETKVAQDAPLKPSMDIFAVGCVIAELFLEGQPLFELAQLLAYRRGQHDPSQHLEKIPDPGIRKMILHMIQLEPEARLSAENYLQNYVGVIFPNYFSPFLHTLYCCWNTLPSDMRVATCQGIFQEILKKMMENKPGDEMGVDSPLPSHPVNASKVQETFLSHRQYLEISREVKPTEKKTIPEPPSISFSSLPHEIAENILARVSRWKYPRLSLVSKSFRSLLSSTEIYKTRSQIGANETCVYICLELPDQPCARWFSLWTNPDKTRTKRIGTKTRFKRDSSGNSVLQIPFSSSPSAPLPYDTQTVGSEIYIIGGPHKKPSSSVRILDCKSQTWRDAPNMTVARENAATALVDDKIYVVGGCNIDAYSTNWIEVFDITSQSWTALPGPGSLVDDELPDDDDYCNIVNVFEGKIYLTIDEKDYTYDSKDDTWKLVRVETSFLSSVKVWWEMENVLYCCTDLGYLMWSGCEIEGREWREIKGLNKLRKHLKTGNEIEMVKYGAKLLVMWHSYPDLCMGNKIWYAKICLESRCNGGEVWGKVECVDVLTFPVESFANFYCLTASV